ncbi:hypothetical protein JVU11DRAFT_3942 [Chiua virens]|nr:hypothetical protein JVU11DRAFT_3942 [Chiua virens]
MPLPTVSAQCAVEVLRARRQSEMDQRSKSSNSSRNGTLSGWNVHSALDTILESLGGQLVPPGFHQTSTDSSLFGSQHSLDKPKGIIDPTLSPSATVRENMFEKKLTKKHVDRSTWKTLRDFVDESAIEQVLEAVESDRTRLDDTMSATYDYPETLSATVSSIRDSLPVADAPPIQSLLASQESTTTEMAGHLESLASHYEQMADALHDSEAGTSHSEEEMQAIHRDTEELPAIMGELEADVYSIQETHEKLILAKTAAQEQLDTEP